MVERDDARVEETILLEKKLREMGFRLADEINLHRGIIGQKLKIVPVRIGMPGEDPSTVGEVFGPPKRDTQYPIDQIRVIEEKGAYYVLLFSSKAGNQHIVERPIYVSQPGSFKRTAASLLAKRARNEAIAAEKIGQLAKVGPLIKDPRLKAIAVGANTAAGPIARVSRNIQRRAERIANEPSSSPDPEVIDVEARVIPNERPHAPPDRDEPIQGGGEDDTGLKLIIESYPVPGFAVTIFRTGNKKTLTLDDFKTAFPPKNHPLYGPVEIAENGHELYKEYKKKKFENIDEAEKWLYEHAANYIQFSPGQVIGYILENEYGKDEDVLKSKDLKKVIKVYSESGRLSFPIKENFKTRLEVSLPRGDYIVSIEQSKGEFTFQQWKINRPSAGKLNPIVTDKNKVKIHLTEPLRMIAFYSERGGTAKHEDRPLTGSPYRGGMQRPTDRLTAALGISGIRDRLGRVVDTNKSSLKSSEAEAYSRNPRFLAAVNKGKRILNQYGKIEYERIFGDFKKIWKYEKEQIKLDEKSKKDDFNAAKKAVKAAKDRLGSKKNDPAALAAYRQALQSERDAFVKLRDIQLGLTFAKKFHDDLERRSATLNSALNERADTITKMVCRRYQIPLNSSEQTAVGAELSAYATDLAEDFATRGNTFRHGMMRGIGTASRATQTIGGAGTNILQSVWDFVFGPWTWITLIVIAQFFFVLNFVGPNALYLWMLPLIGGVFAFLLNFSDSFRPLDWWTHLMGGASVAYSSLLFLIAIDALDWAGSLFLVVWGIVMFIAMMQFYQTLGWRGALQGAAFILIFGWVALGPYSAYYNQALDQVRAPVEIIYNGLSDAFTNIWLLATNPTEFYARQQVMNVKPESPVDIRKGVEVTVLEALPPSVPAGQEFGLSIVLANQGRLEESAKSVSINFSCNQWCESRSAQPNDFDPDKSKMNTNPKVFFVSEEMERGDAKAINIRGFTALGNSDRAGEARIAKVTFNVAYHYSTSSSLLTRIMGQDEVDRRLQNNEELFKVETATGKLSPAQISLNVGPQPLISSENKVLLLVSVFSTRPDGTVRLTQGSNIILTLPRTIGTELDCDNNIADTSDPNKEVLVYTIPNDVEILSSKFNSIYSFICEFKPQAIDDVRSDLITAELPDYTFVLKKEKDIPVTPRLGIFFDPYERVCNACGDGLFEECDVDECAALTNTDPNKAQVGVCYYEFAGSGRIELLPDVPTPQTLWGNPCHSCSKSDDCSDFLTPQTCTSQSSICGLNCRWDETVESPSLLNLPENVRASYLDPTPGSCVKDVIPGIPIDTSSSLVCKDIPQAYRAKFNQYTDIIESAIKANKLQEALPSGSNARALVAAVITQESRWNERASGDNGQSFGLMQIYASKHPECNSVKLKAFDVEENINCGVRFLATIAKNYNIDGSRTYYCANGISGSQINYEGIAAILRWYNGWPTAGPNQCAGTPKYVPEATGHYSQWESCFQSPALGSDTYCSNKLAQTQNKCSFGQGQCVDSGECSTGLECRDPLIGKNLCCRQPAAGQTLAQANQECIAEFNRLTGN